MTKANLFEVATRNKYRFPFKGMVNVEDLWDMSLDNLDVVFKKLNKDLKATENEESLMNNNSEPQKELINKVEILKLIADIKKEEQLHNQQEVENKMKKQKILEIMRSKKDEDLKGKTVEELNQMLEELS